MLQLPDDIQRILLAVGTGSDRLCHPYCGKCIFALEHRRSPGHRESADVIADACRIPSGFVTADFLYPADFVCESPEKFIR